MSGLVWDQTSALQTPCFRLSGLAARQECHWGGFHLGPSSVRKSHLHFARGIPVPTLVASCCPHGDAVNGELVGDLWGSSGCAVGVLFLRHILDRLFYRCMVEAKSSGHWDRTRREHQSLESFCFESLEPLPIFSSAISRLLGLFQLLGEEVSGRAQPDGIFFHGSREPLHALCSHPALQCPVALGSC